MRCCPLLNHCVQELIDACQDPQPPFVEQAGQCHRCRAELGVHGRLCEHCRLDEVGEGADAEACQDTGWRVGLSSSERRCWSAACWFLNCMPSGLCHTYCQPVSQSQGKHVC